MLQQASAFTASSSEAESEGGAPPCTGLPQSPSMILNSQSQTMDAILNAMQEELTCPVCLESFSSPRLLRCGHNFCASCISALLKRGGNTVVCPVCRVKTFLNPQNPTVSDLSPNYFVNTILDALKRKPVRSVAHRTMCASHKSEEIKFVCQTCRASATLENPCSPFLCSECIVTAKHVSALHENHTLQTLRTAANDALPRLQSSVKTGRAHVRNIEAGMGNVIDRVRTLEVNRTRALESLEEQFEALVAALALRKTQLAREVTSRIESEREAARKHFEQLRDCRVAVKKACMAAEKTLEQDDAVKVVLHEPAVVRDIAQQVSRPLPEFEVLNTFILPLVTADFSALGCLETREQAVWLTVHVKFEGDREYEIPLTGFDNSIAALQAKIESRTGVPVERQHLLVNGKDMEEHHLTQGLGTVELLNSKAKE